MPRPLDLIIKEKSEEVLEKLFNRRIILLKGEISKQAADNIIAMLTILAVRSNEKIDLIIDSGGGSVDETFRIVNCLGLLKPVIRGIVVGECSSMAIMILQACHKRYSCKLVKFHIHRFSISRSNMQNIIFERSLKEILDAEKEYVDFVSKRMGLSKKKLWALMDRGSLYIIDYSATEALKLGLIDRIIHFREKDFQII